MAPTQTAHWLACRFQDGAATANNPSGIALAEAARLWPDVPVECLISLGSGSVPVKPREKSMSAYLDTGEPHRLKNHRLVAIYLWRFCNKSSVYPMSTYLDAGKHLPKKPS